MLASNSLAMYISFLTYCFTESPEECKIRFLGRTFAIQAIIDPCMLMPRQYLQTINNAQNCGKTQLRNIDENILDHFGSK